MEETGCNKQHFGNTLSFSYRQNFAIYLTKNESKHFFPWSIFFFTDFPKPCARVRAVHGCLCTNIGRVKRNKNENASFACIRAHIKTKMRNVQKYGK